MPAHSHPALRVKTGNIRTIFGKAAHQCAFVISIFQPVKEHMIIQLVMLTCRRLVLLGLNKGHWSCFHAAGHHQLRAACFDRIMT